MTTSNEKKSVRTLVPLELLEPLLKFPSGLSVPQAKTNAKQLKKAQGISQSEALKLVCWGNGVIDIKDYSQAVEQLIVTTFGRSRDAFGFIESGEKITGVWWSKNETGKYESICSASFDIGSYNYEEDCKYWLGRLLEHLNSIEQGKVKRSKFLVAVKDCINFIEHDFYSFYNGRTLETIESIHDLNINMEALLFGGDDCRGTQLMSYALASCYNANYASRLFIERELESIYQNTDLIKCDLSTLKGRQQLTEYISYYGQFGIMCSNLDSGNKSIIKRLLDNYHGW